MAQRLTAANIETAVLQIFGYSSSAVAPWKASDGNAADSTATFVVRLNEYVQRLPMAITATARQMGLIPQTTGIMYFDMWRTVANMTTASANSTVWFPANYDKWISFYNTTDKIPLEVVEETDRYFVDELRNGPPGPTKAIEILGWETGANSSWLRKGILYPPVAANTTPDISLTYWRTPTRMTNSTELPDIDPKYESIAIWGVAKDLALPSSIEYDRLAALEKEMLITMALTARNL